MPTSESPRFTSFSTSIVAGDGSAAFDDDADAKGKPIIGIAKLSLWVDGVVTGLQVTYSLADGKTYRAPLRGSKTGKRSNIELEADEEIIQLAGRGNTGSITSLSLLSTKVDGTTRLHGPFGDGELEVKAKGKVVAYKNVEMIVGGSDAQGFSWYGGKVMAFVGATRDDRLTGLGVLTAPILEGVEGVSSTSVISQEYRELKSGSKGQKKLESYPAYRSIVTLPGGTKEVSLWAEEQLKVTINGKARTLDPVKPTTVAPNDVGKLSVVVDATDISVPAIKIRTDGMSDPWQWYSLHPDVAAHAKIAAWDSDTLYDNRSKLGMSNTVTKEDCAAVQTAVSNVAKLGLPTAGQASYERRIDANNMDDANWMLDLGGDGIGYSKVSKSEAKKAKDEATTVSRGAAASGIKKTLNKAGKKTKKATSSVSKVVVETAKTTTKTVADAGGSKVVSDLVETANDVVDTGEQVGTDLSKGKVGAAAKHLGQGGLELGRDVGKLGKHAVVTVINVAGEAVEYVLDRTVALGKLMWDLLQTLGAKLMKLIELLLDLIPWNAIAKTQKQLMGVLEQALGGLSEERVAEITGQIDGFFDDLREGGEKALDDATRKLGGKVEPSGGIKSAAASASDKTKKLDSSAGKAFDKIQKILSKPLELVSWLINKLLESIPGLKTLTKALATAAKKVAGVLADLMSSAARALKVLPPALGSSLTNLMEIAKKPAEAPTLIASAVLQLVKGVMGVSLELASELITAMFRGVQTLGELLLELGKTDLFPGKKKGFIADFFDFVVGGELSLFKLLTFVLAIPITLVHLAVYGKAPNLKAPAQRADTDKIVKTTYLVTDVVCSAAELAIGAFLDGIDLVKGTRAYANLESGESQTFGDKNPKATLALEILSLSCGVIGNVVGNPYQFADKPQNERAKLKNVSEQVFYWIGVAQLMLDIATLIKDQKRAVRADLADENPGREGAYITLAFEFLMLTAKSVVAGVGKREGLGLASDIIDSVGSVVEASMLSAFPQGNEKVAAACVVSDVAFGVTQISLGLAADV
ncbi:MAG: hypothetical protein H6712_20295 [Myxococcales bacterium]|nr:hypothetical protein [Myxococcales bacterium]MCB9716218.1 hypothetical protein [Myxococcales bacterium]